jgi:hypothetical protein
MLSVANADDIEQLPFRWSACDAEIHISGLKQHHNKDSCIKLSGFVNLRSLIFI